MSGLPPVVPIARAPRMPAVPAAPGDLRRRPELAAAGLYDLAIVGGGIYGAALALEASRRGLSTLLLERGDFGGATTWNSLRIVHGGLRYLQSFDLPRFRESVEERRWLLSTFPDLVEPLACLMPLYDPPRGGALRRPAAFRAALTANSWLGRLLGQGNGGLAPDRRLPGGSVLGAAETAARFPGVDREGLCGGALWYDAVAPDSQRLLIEMLRWAAACGAKALNYMEAVGLRRERGRIVGVEARDRISGARLLFAAKKVANCAGPWSPLVARRLDRDVPGLFRPVLAWNVFLDREPLAPVALAAAAKRPGSPTYFVLPWKGRMLAGTAYAAGTTGAPGAVDPDPGQGRPDPERVAGFLDDLNAALPALGARADQVLRVHWGWLPASADTPSAPSSRPVIHDHGAHGGQPGLVSVSGVKLTTARAVAQETLRVLFAKDGKGQGLPAIQAGAASRPAADPPLPLEELARRSAEDPEAVRRDLQALAGRQAAVQLEDLLLRRTDWGIDPQRAAVAERLCETLVWGAAPEDALTRRPAAVRGVG